MSYVTKLVCLAISYKPPNGRCIAGRQVLRDGEYGGWIRPVSARPTAEVIFSEYKYQNDTTPKLLDIIDVPMLKAAPHNHQTENHVIDAKKSWVKTGQLSWGELEKLRERPASLWTNSDHTNPGHYDCMSKTEAATLESSLLLIKKSNFVVEVGSNPWTGRPVYRGKFDYEHTHYNLSLTDPVAREVFAPKGEGDYALKDVYLCVSLTEPYEKDGRCHKLVAAIISNPPL
jgi:putative nucleic acid modification protein with dual OB domain